MARQQALLAVAVCACALLAFIGTASAIIQPPPPPPAPVCGDGNVDQNEQCDDGNTAAADGCGPTCLVEYCNDGIVNAFIDHFTGELVLEQCDDGPETATDSPAGNQDDGPCTSRCQINVCGDGLVRDFGPLPVEQCEDGNTWHGDGCAECRFNVCGDGHLWNIVYGGTEYCDDGNEEDGDGCDSNCLPEVCGDGIWSELEECDDGNTSNFDGCDANCALELCGNDVVQPHLGETCDDLLDFFNCFDCLVVECGNGRVEFGEECDDGNAFNNDECLNTCQLNDNCGDGFHNTNYDQPTQEFVNWRRLLNLFPGQEACDDGNQVDNDGCSAICQVEYCGDGTVQTNEECDDGTPDSDTSGACVRCKDARCGDGFVGNGEQCDDGNTRNGDGCDDSCNSETCGDFTINNGEDCEYVQIVAPPSTGPEQHCTEDCRWEENKPTYSAVWGPNDTPGVNTGSFWYPSITFRATYADPIDLDAADFFVSAGPFQQYTVTVLGPDSGPKTVWEVEVVMTRVQVVHNHGAPLVSFEVKHGRGSPPSTIQNRFGMYYTPMTPTLTGSQTGLHRFTFTLTLQHALNIPLTAFNLTTPAMTVHRSLVPQNPNGFGQATVWTYDVVLDGTNEPGDVTLVFTGLGVRPPMAYPPAVVVPFDVSTAVLTSDVDMTGVTYHNVIEFTLQFDRPSTLAANDLTFLVDGTESVLLGIGQSVSQINPTRWKVTVGPFNVPELDPLDPASLLAVLPPNANGAVPATLGSNTLQLQFIPVVPHLSSETNGLDIVFTVEFRTGGPNMELVNVAGITSADFNIDTDGEIDVVGTGSVVPVSNAGGVGSMGFHTWELHISAAAWTTGTVSAGFLRFTGAAVPAFDFSVPRVVTVEFDPPRPTLSMVDSSGDSTTNSVMEFTATYSHAVSGVSVADFSVQFSTSLGGSTVAVSSQSATVWVLTVNVDPLLLSTTVTVGLPQGSGNILPIPGPVLNGPLVLHYSAPTVQLSTHAQQPFSVDTLVFTATFSRPVNGLSLANWNLQGPVDEAVQIPTVSLVPITVWRLAVRVRTPTSSEAVSVVINAGAAGVVPATLGSNPVARNHIGPCFPHPCNAGTCTEGDNGDHTCTCPIGLLGDSCELDVDDCPAGACHNGGTCVDEVNGWHCDCPAGIVGPTCQDACPNDPNKVAPGVCGCGVSDKDTDSDGTVDCNDQCPGDATKTAPGDCGCGNPDTDANNDNVSDCLTSCTSPTDSDSDGTPDCRDACPFDPTKAAAGVCGCGVPDTDTDSDGVPNCRDSCPLNPAKTAPGPCGCSGNDGIDSDNDGAPDCVDQCPGDASKQVPGACGCGVADTDSDSDGSADCIDLCPADPSKVGPGQCGCGVADTDSDGDGTANCNDACPADASKTAPGDCGCGNPDSDTNTDGISDCLQACFPNPCLNGGVCSESGSSVSCTCGTGFSGDRCQDVESCTSCTEGAGPCRHDNDGSCLPYVAGTSICQAGSRPCAGTGGGGGGGGGTTPPTGGQCTGCFVGTSGPCRNPANTVCYAYQQGSQCPSGTVACEVVAPASAGAGSFSVAVAGVAVQDIDQAAIDAVVAAAAFSMGVPSASVTVTYTVPANDGSDTRVGFVVSDSQADGESSAKALTDAVRSGSFQLALVASGVASAGVSDLTGTAAANAASNSNAATSGAAAGAGSSSGAIAFVAVGVVGAVVVAALVATIIVVRSRRSAGMSRVHSSHVHAIAPVKSPKSSSAKSDAEPRSAAAVGSGKARRHGWK